MTNQMPEKRYAVVPSEAKHVAMLDAALRQRDRDEVVMAGLQTRRTIWRCYRHSVWARTGFIDGKIACMGGVSGNILAGLGTLWFLTTPAIELLPIVLVKEGRRAVAHMLDLYPHLIVATEAAYTGANRLIEALGFTLDGDFLFGPNAMPMRLYSMRRQ